MKTILVAMAALVLAGCAPFDAATQSTLGRYMVEQH